MNIVGLSERHLQVIPAHVDVAVSGQDANISIVRWNERHLHVIPAHFDVAVNGKDASIRDRQYLFVTV